MKITAFKYATPFLICFFAWISFMSTGVVTFLPVIWAFIIIPVLELFFKPDDKNLEEAEEEIAKMDPVYDYILYAMPIALYLLLFKFLSSFQHADLITIDIVGRILSMGILCGALGINVAHELGHRSDKYERSLAKMLLLCSLYMHFYIEHNKGHHKNVGTHNDPNTARKNEWLFAFFIRSITRGYIHAWQIANAAVRKKGFYIFSLRNEMVQFTLIQLLFILAILISYDFTVTLYYLAAVTLGVLLLETVNYIEHYGLKRKEIVDEKFKRAMPSHSWNSNHVLGRIMLFELSRHSDHHYLASRKYQVLQHHSNSPQLPTGYPGMMILACIPPLFFYVMNKKIKQFT